MFNTDENPPEAGMYLVDRGSSFIGHWYRYYDGKKNWSLMHETYAGAHFLKNTKSPLGPLPWKFIKQRTESELQPIVPVEVAILPGVPVKRGRGRPRKHPVA
jgi:hypothetical protein